RTWGLDELTGGPLDAIISALRTEFPDLRVERLQVTHPADDDNVWFVSRPPLDGDIQIDTRPDGRPPFLIESDRGRVSTHDVDEAAGLLRRWLVPADEGVRGPAA